jgi:hypothetical protein
MLLNKNVYCATYWPNVQIWCSKEYNLYSLTENVIALTLDQRYSENELFYLLEQLDILEKTL